MKFNKKIISGDIQKLKNSKSDLIFGIQPVLGALRYKKRVLKMLFLKKSKSFSIRFKEIRELANRIDLPVTEVSSTELSGMCPNSVHQGVVLHCGTLPFFSIKDLNKLLIEKFSIIVALDQVEDPHNFGAILRTCGFYNVSAVVVPRDHTSSLSPVVSKVSAGVLEWLPVIAVPNLARFLCEQKSKGQWVVGLEGKASENLSDLKRDRSLILVLGNEGRGIRHLIKKHCDCLISIPGNNEVSSLNVSNSAAITLFHLSK